MDLRRSHALGVFGSQLHAATDTGFGHKRVVGRFSANSEEDETIKPKTKPTPIGDELHGSRKV